mmetsp:Transcript_2208/g.5208  ORF Transcript_2208/g.5208 Transcript_2208/m.5208 type:complete len:303 (+) Transcript_2208:92-1000(+)|eukprot:CAMPEP_0178999238 /NCGR_PEP_ID=MMETSP0795-20121207/9940_1 /TAXON_ID=88552 /ORGANISM="Amoebophrya sp., Strain Ameob2" /LENGTH=302 /DNA_ID=CAMNT_0020691971 /DNA_START=63 /DNA_END=971 /DNA_ORIENTATION=+
MMRYFFEEHQALLTTGTSSSSSSQIVSLISTLNSYERVLSRKAKGAGRVAGVGRSGDFNVHARLRRTGPHHDPGPRTVFYDIPGPEQEWDWRPPIFDPHLKYFVDAARDNFEKVTMGRKSAQMAAHVATMASTAAIAKAHQLVYDVQHQSVRPKHELFDDVAPLELEATQKCEKSGFCSRTDAQSEAWAEFKAKKDGENAAMKKEVDEFLEKKKSKGKAQEEKNQKSASGQGETDLTDKEVASLEELKTEQTFLEPEGQEDETNKEPSASGGQIENQEAATNDEGNSEVVKNPTPTEQGGQV